MSQRRTKLMKLGLLFLSVFLLAWSTAAEAQDDRAYCNELVSLYRRYIQNSPGHQFDIDAINAIEQCQKGKVEAGIPVLEKKLRQGQISLPGNFKP
jgi:hypothetical protein